MAGVGFLPQLSEPMTDTTKSDAVNHPSHYTYGGKWEAIDIIESAVVRAPDVVVAGLHWNVLKYILRLWHKADPLQDARKARWYLDRMISFLEARANDG